jgi:hypothetical protein
MNLLRVAILLINFWTSWRLSGGFILEMANTFFGLGPVDTTTGDHIPE